MWEDPIVKEVHDIRERLAAEQNFDIKAIFADIYRRQALQADKLVPPKKKAERSAEFDQSHQSVSSGPTFSEEAPAA